VASDRGADSRVNPGNATILPPAPVLVTGAGGFIGGQLTRRLLGQGGRVRVLVRSTEQAAAFRALGAEPVLGDLTARAGLDEAVRGCALVFHCAAWMGTPWSWEAAWAVNVEGTRALTAAALAAGVRRFVHVSSISVYGPTLAETIDEQSPLWPLGPYRATKIGAEAVVMEAHRGGLSTVILRPGQVFGPGDRRLSGLVLRYLQRGLPVLVGGGRGHCYPLYIENFIDALLLAAAAPQADGRAFNVADGDVPWREFLGSYARMRGYPLRSAPIWVTRAVIVGMQAAALVTGAPARGHRPDIAYFMRQSRYSTKQAREVLGWNPRVSLEEAMRDTEAWLTEAGLLPSRAQPAVT